MMPIKPENKARYPKNWKDIRLAILGRADNRCEWAGCGVQNYDLHPVTGSKVVLTIAHLDHQPENCAHSNLMAMCQMHHLAYDQKHHHQSSYQTRRAGKADDMFASTTVARGLDVMATRNTSGFADTGAEKP